MFPFRCLNSPLLVLFSHLMQRERTGGGLGFCVFFLICAVNYCAVRCVSSLVY